MGAKSKIEWTDNTFNPWIGCTRVGPGCDHCYAERFGQRFGVAWGPGALRRRTSEANWREPLRWAARIRITGGPRERVFCASLADVFDHEAPEVWRQDLWALIRATRDVLDWLLLTKRIGNAASMLPPDLQDGEPGVWLGMTAVTQEEFDRDWRKMARLKAYIRFLSYEPALGPLSLKNEFALYQHGALDIDAEPTVMDLKWLSQLGGRWSDSPDWLITGGESGPGARPPHPDWFRQVREQCKAAGVPFFLKQITDARGQKLPMNEWPEDLQNLREYPHA